MTPRPVISEFFEQQAAKKPTAIALVCEGASLTFAELNARANQLARGLRERGVGPEVFAGVSIERSPEAVVALLGILKAGGAYVYLDPHLPRQRLQYFCHNSGLRLVVTSGGAAAPLDGVLAVDLDSFEWPRYTASNVPSQVTPDHAAYVLYTSGSTGEPKGAVEIHRCLTARLGRGELPDVREHDVCGLNSSLGFGISASRLFLPLALGAKVVILPEADLHDAHRLVAAVETHGISSLFLPPVLLRLILALDPGALARLTRLRAVTMTGSALTPELAAAFFRTFPEALLVNVYGSTETGTAALMNVLTQASDLSAISIGRSVAGTQVLITNDEGHPVSDDEVGEIRVSSEHLARGYLNDPMRTSERFISTREGRFYRTGDLGRVLPNGEIQLLGRRDLQLNVRGFRVEIGEIEAVLSAHPTVLEAVVTAQSDEQAENRLTGYFVATPGANPRTGELRRFLRERLPSYMIPASLVRLTEMPRTASGKVDRRNLPACDPARPDLDTPFEAPRNHVESELARIWAEVLKLANVGVHDGFLDLGGDSLAATRIIVRVLDRFKTQLTLESIFDQTIAEIASSRG